MDPQRFKKFLTVIGALMGVPMSRLRSSYNVYVKPITSPLYVLTGVLSILLLVLEFGFYLPNIASAYLHQAAAYLVYYLLFYEIMSFVFAPRESFLLYAGSHKLQLSIILSASSILLFRDELITFLGLEGFSREHAPLLVLWINQFLLIFGSFFHLAKHAGFVRLRKTNPAMIFIASFAAIIFTGFALFHMPRLHAVPIGSLDLLFTAVSAVCVTGLSTLDIAASFTFSGKLLLLILIQVGGLGLMTLTSFFAFFLAGRASVQTQIMLKDLLSEDSIGRVRRLIKEIALLTFWIEGTGALYLFLTMPEHLYSSPGQRIFLAIFHSISAFCNAGFSLHPDSLSKLGPEGHPYLLGLSLLIILGGLGVPVIIALLRKAVQPRSRFIRFSLSVKLVLFVNLLLYGAAFASYFLLEFNHSLKDLGTLDQLVHSFFYSVSLRTAGFNTLPMGAMGHAMVFASFFYMWVGASPLSTGGGIKTSTVAVAMVHLFNQLTGREKVEIFHRTISKDSVSRAYATIIVSLMTIFLGTFIILIIEGGDFLDIAFETVSAVSTVGLSRGITSSLSPASKIILCVLMLMGRVGIFTSLVAFLPRGQHPAYRYPDEYVAVG